MPLIRLNASPETGHIRLHGSPQCPWATMATAAKGAGPIIIMIHGYKYHPGSPRNCPHRTIFDAAQGWPGALETPDHPHLSVCFGWPARGSLGAVFQTARQTGASLAQVIATFHKAAPHRPIHLIAHSMGAEVALCALEHAPAGSVTRMILITGATLQSHAQRALHSPAGRQAEVFNITSRENDLFDFLFERLLMACPGERAIGHGIAAPNVLNIQLDCSATLAALAQVSCVIAPAQRHICHWSGYTRPGAMAFYAGLMVHPERLTLAKLTRLLPARPSPRWSRLPLAGLTKNRIMERTIA